MVWHQLPKLTFAGSSPVSCSNSGVARLLAVFLYMSLVFCDMTMILCGYHNSKKHPI